MQFTAQTKIDDAHAEFLDRTAGYTGNIRAKLLNDLLNGLPVNDLKKQYIAEYGINAGQFNSLSSEVRGVIQSAGELKKTV